MLFAETDYFFLIEGCLVPIAIKITKSVCLLHLSRVFPDHSILLLPFSDFSQSNNQVAYSSLIVFHDFFITDSPKPNFSPKFLIICN